MEETALIILFVVFIFWLFGFIAVSVFRIATRSKQLSPVARFVVYPSITGVGLFLLFTVPLLFRADAEIFILIFNFLRRSKTYCLSRSSTCSFTYS